MVDSQDWFLTGAALDALSEWSNLLKSFQQQLSVHFVRSEARLAAYDYIRALTRAQLNGKTHGRWQSRWDKIILTACSIC